MLKNREFQVMLGTETIGRGVDIRTVVLVINYSEPIKNKEEVCTTAYIHRVGRTGRYSDQGVALTFVGSEVFVKVAEEQQKIKFQKMSSIKEVVDLAEDCSNKNEIVELVEEHRYEYKR